MIVRASRGNDRYERRKKKRDGVFPRIPSPTRLGWMGHVATEFFRPRGTCEATPNTPLKCDLLFDLSRGSRMLFTRWTWTSMVVLFPRSSVSQQIPCVDYVQLCLGPLLGRQSLPKCSFPATTRPPRSFLLPSRLFVLEKNAGMISARGVRHSRWQSPRP